MRWNRGPLLSEWVGLMQRIPIGFDTSAARHTGRTAVGSDILVSASSQEQGGCWLQAAKGVALPPPTPYPRLKHLRRPLGVFPPAEKLIRLRGATARGTSCRWRMRPRGGRRIGQRALPDSRDKAREGRCFGTKLRVIDCFKEEWFMRKAICTTSGTRLSSWSQASSTSDVARS